MAGQPTAWSASQTHEFLNEHGVVPVRSPLEPSDAAGDTEELVRAALRTGMELEAQIRAQESDYELVVELERVCEGLVESAARRDDAVAVEHEQLSTRAEALQQRLSRMVQEMGPTIEHAYAGHRGGVASAMRCLRDEREQQGLDGGPVERCMDCGVEGAMVGHMECQYPGRYSEREMPDDVYEVGL